MHLKFVLLFLAIACLSQGEADQKDKVSSAEKSGLTGLFLL